MYWFDTYEYIMCCSIMRRNRFRIAQTFPPQGKSIRVLDLRDNSAGFLRTAHAGRPWLDWPSRESSPEGRPGRPPPDPDTEA